MKDYRTSLLLLLLATILITLFSCCSWIYPLQPYDDANWFMTIGKSMLSGKLLYTEVHDQKGPVLFFLHEWAAALSSKTFVGIYMLEILCAFGFLACSYKVMRLFARHGISLIATCLVGVLTYTSDFMLYGDSVEEFSLPILLYILYKTLRYAKLGDLPGNGESVLIGVGMAAIFWMKFTVLAMCVGALAATLVLAWRRSQMMPLLQCLSWMTAGAAGLTAGVLLYFVIHGNEADLYRSYFYLNIFKYSEAGKMDASAAWWPAKWAGWVLMVGAVLLMRVSRDVRLTVAACLGAELLTFVLMKVYLYYFLTIFVFAPLMIYFIRRIHSRMVVAVGFVVVSLFSVATNYNLMTLLTGNFPKAALSLARVINEDDDPEKEVLTVKSYDTGIYTLTDCLPPIKYFVTPNVYIEELVTEQTEYLESCRAKYLAMKTKEPIYYSSFRPDLTRDYELVCEAEKNYRHEFLLHPLQFLWSIGYMRGLMEHFYTPEHDVFYYRLYRLKHPEAARRAAERDSLALMGEWKMRSDAKHGFCLNFSGQGLVRCKTFAPDGQGMDATYSYTYHRRTLKLGYMFTGETYKSVRVLKLSADRLVLHGWPARGECVFIRQ